MNIKLYLIPMTVFLILADCSILGVLCFITVSTFLETSEFPFFAVFFVPIIAYLSFFNYYFFRYYYNGVRKIEYISNGINLCFDKTVKTILFSDIYKIKRSKLTQRVFIKSKKGKYIFYIYKNSPFKTQNFDYELLTRMTNAE